MSAPHPPLAPLAPHPPLAPLVPPASPNASVAQASLYFLRELMPCKTPYNTGVQFRLTGDLDEEALTRALREVVRRHDSLRTTFALGEKGVVQVVASPDSPDSRAGMDFELVDLSADPGREETAKRIGAELDGKDFDLARGPLFRVRLLRFGPRDRALVVVMDHIISDGTSLDILWRELGALYRAFKAGEPSPLAPPSHQFAEAVPLQDAWRETPAFARQLAYWKEHLAGAEPGELPEDRPRPAVKTYRGGFASAPIPAELAAPIRELAAKESVSLFTTLLAVLNVLVARYTAQPDVLIAIPTASRQRFGMEDVFGFFANMVVLRTDVKGALPFRELLKNVNKELMNGIFRQDVPFERVVEAVRPNRSLAHDPLARICLSFLAAGGAKLDLPGIEATFSELPNGGAKFDLHLTITDLEGRLGCIAEYNADVFEPATIDRILRHYAALLTAVAATPDGEVGKLPLLSDDERRQILVDWNQTARPLPDVTASHELFERQVDAGPDRPCVVFKDTTLTYGEVDRRANQLAHHLAAMGIAPRSVVGVFLERSENVVVALLAAWKAGATYVPIDPDYPADRIAMMIGDSKLAAVITVEKLTAQLPTETPAVALDRDATAIAARPTARPAPPFSRAPGEPPTDAPCYIIYTSGSTGRPKGVVVHHRGIVNFVQSMIRRPGMTADDTLLAVITLSFDMACFELWVSLAVGARIVIAGGDETSDGEALRRLIETRDVTVMQATPTTWRLLLSAGWRGKKNFKAMSGGEPFPPPIAAQLLDSVGEVWNGYGPTETVVYSTCVQLKKDAPITIGGPIDNTTVYVVDSRLQPVPIGVLGELMIGGTGVTHGYLERPELTASKFVADPFSPTPGARMYKTGDLVAFRADGEIVYQRRLDHQVKVRGYRIELGEIEAALAKHEAIGQVVVIVREDRPGDTRLVAYFVPRPGKSGVTATDLRKHLRRDLPDYMVPQHFIEVASLPLTPAGKVDRKALPAPQGAARTEATWAPSTPNERLVARIWAEVLGHDRIGATDNFFDLGGHSLLSMMVIARIRTETDYTVSPRDLLLSSLEQIAALLPGGKPADKPAPAAPNAPARQESRREKALGIVGKIGKKLFG